MKWKEFIEAYCSKSSRPAHVFSHNVAMKADEYLGRLKQAFSLLSGTEMDTETREEMTAVLVMLTICFECGISGIKIEELIFELGVLQVEFGSITLPKDKIGDILESRSVAVLFKEVIGHLRSYPPYCA